MTLNCSICEKEINIDRYNITYELERQDFPNKSNWQKSVDLYLENICSNCQSTINSYYRGLIQHLRANKGKIKQD